MSTGTGVALPLPAYVRTPAGQVMKERAVLVVEADPASQRGFEATLRNAIEEFAP